MFDDVGGRKFLLAIVGFIMLFAATMVGKLDGVAFTGGMVALLGVFVEGNVRSKKIYQDGGKKK